MEFLNTSSGDGCTAFHLACAGGHPDCAEALLHAGADHKARDIYGETVHPQPLGTCSLADHVCVCGKLRPKISGFVRQGYTLATKAGYASVCGRVRGFVGDGSTGPAGTGIYGAQTNGDVLALLEAGGVMGQVRHTQRLA